MHDLRKNAHVNVTFILSVTGLEHAKVNPSLLIGRVRPLPDDNSSLINTQLTGGGAMFRAWKKLGSCNLENVLTSISYL